MIEDPAKLVADLKARDDQLTDWERSLIGSINMRLYEKRGVLTKQAKVLQEIYNSTTEQKR